MHFTNSGIIIGTDPLKPRLDLWHRVWNRGSGQASSNARSPAPAPVDTAATAIQTSAGQAPIPVNVSNFIRAETDLYFGKTVKEAGLGKLHHRRAMTSIDERLALGKVSAWYPHPDVFIGVGPGYGENLE